MASPPLSAQKVNQQADSIATTRPGSMTPSLPSCMTPTLPCASTPTLSSELWQKPAVPNPFNTGGAQPKPGQKQMTPRVPVKLPAAPVTKSARSVSSNGSSTNSTYTAGYTVGTESQASQLPVAESPLPQDRTLQSVVARMSQALRAYYQKRGVHVGSAGHWEKFFKEINADRNGKLTFEELDAAVRIKLRADLSRYELRVFWRRLDSNGSGLVTTTEFAMLMYRADLATWPDISAGELKDCVRKLNAALVKWHNCRGNWFKLFKGADAEGSGGVAFDELVKVIRDSFPGLQMKEKEISDYCLRGLWKALDVDGAMDVSVRRFLTFMRSSSGISMHKLTSYSKKSRGIADAMRDVTAEIAAAPELEIMRARSLASNLAAALHAWLAQRGMTGGPVRMPVPADWDRLFEFADGDRSGRLSFIEFESVCRNVLAVKDITDQEFLSFWHLVDPDASGEATSAEFGGAVYQLQVDAWPDLDDDSLRRLVTTLNAAADKWYRCSGNWYKVFAKVDADGSGTMDYGELVAFLRRPLPCLGLKAKDISEDDLRGFWRRLDSDRSGRITVPEFTYFMRQHGKALSIHRLTEYSKGKRGMAKKKVEIGSPPERSREQLLCTAAALEKACGVYWAQQGIHVNMEGTWARFFNQADGDGSGRLTFLEFEAEIRLRLADARNAVLRGIGRNDAPLELPDEILTKSADPATEVIPGVTRGDLHALWAEVDFDGSDQVTAGEWRLALYQLELEHWPVPDAATLSHVVNELDFAAQKWHRAGGNWFKVFRIIDSDNSGSMRFDEFKEIVYRPLPCLAIPKKRVTERDLRAFWKALDTDRSGECCVQEFMVFMRQHAAKGAKKVSRCATALRSRAETSVALSPSQASLLCDAIGAQSEASLKVAYETRGDHWTGNITEWEFFVVIRSILNLTEDQFEDDVVHTTWTTLDHEGVGEVHVALVLGLEAHSLPIDLEKATRYIPEMVRGTRVLVAQDTPNAFMIVHGFEKHTDSRQGIWYRRSMVVNDTDKHNFAEKGSIVKGELFDGWLELQAVSLSAEELPQKHGLVKSASSQLAWR